MDTVVDELRISNSVAIPLAEIEFQPVRAQGAGGQNVNKVATAIHLRFDYWNSAALPPSIRQRLSQLKDSRIGSGGIVIKSQEHRTQLRNRQAALDRLKELIQSVLVPPKKRVPTKPSRAAKKKRLESKRHQGRVKQYRGKVSDD